MKPSRLIGVAAAALVSTGALASVTYQFSATGILGLGDATFTYISPDFVTTFRHVAAAQLESCTVTSQLLPCDYVEFYPLDPFYPEDQFIEDSLLVFRDNAPDNPPVLGRLATFAPGTFTTPGVYTIGNENFCEQLIVRESSDVPEPASWAMTIAGFGAIGAAMRRHRGAGVRFA